MVALSEATMVIEYDVESGTMHTVDAAEQIKRKLACYYIDDISKGKYGGNEFIIKEKVVLKITDTKELILVIEQLSNILENAKESELMQLCIEELLGADAG